MKDKFYFCIERLPDLEIYGGDTTPWEVPLLNEDRSPCDIEDASLFTFTLTMTPLGVTSGLGDSSIAVSPSLTKQGEVTAASGGGSFVSFSFSKNDTKDLRGKYIYQIEAVSGDVARVCQGHIYIKANNNR